MAWQLGLLGAAAGIVEIGPAYDLLETTTLTSSASSVSFTGLGSYSNYKHLQIRMVTRTGRASIDNDNPRIQFNSDTAGNYSWHSLEGWDGSVISGAGTSASFIDLLYSAGAGGSGANVFGANVVDILDAFNTSKYTTTRALSGQSSENRKFVFLTSGSWRNTAALTSITLTTASATDFQIGSRFSLYGIKAA